MAGYSSLHCGTIPVSAFVRPMSVNSSTILRVTSLHCLFVLAESQRALLVS